MLVQREKKYKEDFGKVMWADRHSKCKEKINKCPRSVPTVDTASVPANNVPSPQRDSGSNMQMDLHTH